MQDVVLLLAIETLGVVPGEIEAEHGARWVGGYVDGRDLSYKLSFR